MDWEINCHDLIKVAWNLYDQGDFPKALQVWKSIHQLFPNEPEAYRGARARAQENGDYESADTALREGLSRYRQNRLLLGDYAHLAQEQKIGRRQLARWNEYSERFP